MPVGRNDPCPCGSGRKYKRCCLAREQALEEGIVRRRRLQEELEIQMVHFAREAFGADVLAAAREDFRLGREDIDFEAAEFQHFMAWFLYEWRCSPQAGGGPVPSKAGPTIAAAFLEAKGDGIDNGQRRFIESALREPFSFYDVIECEPGRRLRIRDILRNIEHEVPERSASRVLQPGDIVYARVAEIDGQWLLIGAGSVPFPPIEKKVLLDLRKSLRTGLGGIEADLLHGLSDKLREIYFTVRERLLNPPPMQIRNTDGDPLLFHTLTYEVESAQAAFDALKPLAAGWNEKELLHEARLDAGGRLQEVEFSWSRRGNRMHRQWDNTILGRIRIHRRRLIIEVNSEKRARTIRGKIERLLGEGATYLKTEIESTEAALRKAERRDRTPAGKGERRETDELNARPEVQALLRDFTESHWLSWPDNRLPALGGKTPVQAVGDPEGREMVEALLVDFERSQEEAPSRGPRFDFNILRNRLGLERRPRQP